MSATIRTGRRPYTYNRAGDYSIEPLLRMVKSYRRCQWTRIPYTYHWHTTLYALRNRYPEFQFEQDTPPRAWVYEGKHRGKRGYRLRVRYIPPTKRKARTPDVKP